jgi:hypothetical protein
MKFGGVKATSDMVEKEAVQQARRRQDLSKPTPLKGGMGYKPYPIESTTDSTQNIAEVCDVCEGYGYYFPPDSATLGRECPNCIRGWVLPETDAGKFKTGVKVGAGMAVGFTAVSIGFGVIAGVLGLIYQKVTGE